MKALRYLLIVAMVSVASLVFATAQSLAQKPEAQMKSTSGMVYSGSTLPQAAVEGTHTTYDELSETGTNAKGPNKAKKGRPGDWEDPYTDPLGDAALPLMLLALVYMCARAFLKRRA